MQSNFLLLAPVFFAWELSLASKSLSTHKRDWVKMPGIHEMMDESSI